MLLGIAAWLMSGCVVLEEKYNAEKARSLNFQRLLAQEEKRTAELDSEVKRTKKELTEFEARNRELTAQVQSAREQMARLQEEAEAIKESALLERKAMEDMRKPARAPVRAPSPGPEPAGDLAGELAKPAPDILKEVPAVAASSAAAGEPTTHVVKPGETLFRIGKRYGVGTDKLKKWNKLPDDLIEVGQKLIVKVE
jgi:hypothetical protein